jgi:hypothetical protein
MFDDVWGSPAIVIADAMLIRSFDLAEKHREWWFWWRPPLDEIAQNLDIPLVSLLEGFVAGLGLPEDIFLQECRKGGASECAATPPSDALVGRMEWYKRILFAKEGNDNHINDYGHAVFGWLLAMAVVNASRREAPHTAPVAPFNARLPKRTSDLYARLTDRSYESIVCNLTLTHGRGSDLNPVLNDGYSWWTGLFLPGVPSKDGGNMAPRIDLKSAWKPEREGATIDFQLPMYPSFKQLCILVWGRQGSTTQLLWLGRDGEPLEDACNVAHGYENLQLLDVYAFKCECEIPQTVASSGKHDVTIRLVARGDAKGQVAGVAMY